MANLGWQYNTQSSAAWSPKLSGQQPSPYPLGNSIHSNPDVHDSKKNHRCSDETTCNSADQKNGHQQNNTEPAGPIIFAIWVLSDRGIPSPSSLHCSAINNSNLWVLDPY
ncbi:hypothetical protein OIU85_011325 [Salix viminalis]|uniref:Uncharacterized protein n=1 Tax=Salix viminalis TaxID=40686 RepID=A0A9Q0NSI7_SALVM|nr:hypothetical protein OIU85_011325 [Salix viminalis]